MKESASMRIAIVDDAEQERNQLREKLETQLEQDSIYTDITEFDNGAAFLTAAREEAFAAVFLDIYMQGKNGIETAKELRQFDTDCMLVITTTSEDHALEGFRVRAMHYLVKPYTEEELQQTVAEMLQRIGRPDQYLTVKTVNGTVNLRFQNILYAEHHAHQIFITLADGTTVVTRQPFSEFSAAIQEDDRFFVCSRGMLLNLEHAVDLNGSVFVMTNGKNVGVSRDFLKKARQVFMNFLFRKEMEHE